MNENSTIIVEYVCECGNRQPINPDGTRPTYRYCVPVYDNCRMICFSCGKDMKLQVSKENYKREVEIIEEIQDDKQRKI